MRRQPLLWLTISIVCFVAAFYFWRLGDKWAKEAPGKAPAVVPVSQDKPTNTVRLLSVGGNLNVTSTPDTSSAKTDRAVRFAYRLSNTSKPLGELARNPNAILLENALIDTTLPVDLPIPAHLQSSEEPAAWIVQSRGPINDAFRAMIKAAGAEVVAYIPNNAYLVSASAGAARAMAGAGAQAVLPYEPYYKLKSSLLRSASQMTDLPENTTLRVLLFGSRAEATIETLNKAGVDVLERSRSPFGLVVNVRPQPAGLAGLAKLPGVQMIELVQPRVPASDLTRVRIGVSSNSVLAASGNYLGLTGSNILVNLNDTGVDVTHPDFVGRIFADIPTNGEDTNGHGTHVAGIIAGNGSQSTSVSNAIGSVKSGSAYADGQFRGMAPGARLFSMNFKQPDVYLQETAARTNAFISNNSWEYRSTDEYDLAAASYDAAVRDALAEDSGSQPVLYVFSSGNSGNGDENGTGGYADTIGSPATAKNVITVGAIEHPRGVTNKTYKCSTDPSLPPGEVYCTTNMPWIGETDASDQVASFSSRGNVGVSIEGDAGRFKPDVVAPGTFVISTRSAQWDEAAYYNNTSHIHSVFSDLLIEPGSLWTDQLFIPDNAVGAYIRVFASSQSTSPLPDMPIYVRVSEAPTNTAGGYDFVKTNEIIMPDDYPLIYGGFWYGVANTGTNPIYVGIITDVTVTNDNGNYNEVLKQINDDLGQYYRYESGSSMAAASVSGTLALMQEFFEVRLGQTNSPALMKALLINGARSVGGDIYDFNVAPAINFQGWGLVNITNTLPGALENPAASTSAPTLMFDQSPTNALASAQSRTIKVAVDPKAQSDALRVTLVWTDPPGNPAASIKLVNDLDLVVTNLDSGDVFFGNDILAGNDFNAAWNTNSLPTADYINNVENVYLSPNLGTNYSITVIGRHVNVNAVTAHLNDVVQDYALVVSAGNGTVSNALTLVESTTVAATVPWTTIMTNSFLDNPEISGSILYNQHVGANTPLLGTNQIAAPVAGGVITLGMTNQWHFYVITNEFGFTNAAFMTFIPPNLAVPRKGANEIDVENASRIEADIDMYVSTNPDLTNLAPIAVRGSIKSLGRNGSETIILNDAVPGVYYIGIKSEDQQAAEYAFAGVFSLYPFSEEDAMGNQYLRGFPVPQYIEDARLDSANKIVPGTARIFAFSMGPELVRKVVVTNGLSHELLGDLTGTLTHNRDYATLNNHVTNVPSHYEVYNGRTWPTFVFDDSGENTIRGAQGSGGPGTLEDFTGKDGTGQWLFTQMDGAVSHAGTNGQLKIFLERQQDLEEGVVATIQPGACRSDFVRVPAEATNLTVELTILEGSGPLTMRVCPLEEAGSCESTTISNAIGGSVTIDVYDTPPLHEGVYSVRTCNLGTQPVTVRILARIYRSYIVQQSVSNSSGPVALKDDAITYAYITNRTHMRISSLDVGLLFSDPRISDLAVTLISPNGTRVLLFENRGGTTTNGMGSITATTNGFGEVLYEVAQMSPFYTTDFDSAPLGVYAPGSLPDAWNVLTNYATIFPDYSVAGASNNYISLGGSTISHSLPGNNSGQYNLTFKATHAPYLTGTVGWWPFDGDGKDIFGGFDGLLIGGGNTTNYGMFLPGKVSTAFFGNAILTSVLVPAAPELNVASGGFSVEGWVYPSNIVAAAPLVEWVQRSNSAPGVQFWLSGLSWTNPQPGALIAAFMGTNQIVQVATTLTNAMTNSGWQHVAFTYNAAERRASIYANGQLATSQSVPSGVEPVTAGDLYFGFHPGDSTNVASFKGGLDEFGLYNRPLTDCEVAAIYSAGALGKYGTNALTCPIAYEVTLQGDTTTTMVFTNGTSWTSGPAWEQNSIDFSNSVKLASDGGDNTNRVNLIIRPLTPNVALDEFVLSGMATNVINGTMHFTENTNLAVIPIKFATTPYTLSNFPPVLVFSNDFESATPGTYTNGMSITGLNLPGGPHDWAVSNGTVTVISNRMVDTAGTNSLVLGRATVRSTLPTTPGRRYELTYTVRGPGAVGWWNGDLEPLSGRALDLIGGNHGAFVNGATNMEAGLIMEPNGKDMAFYLPTRPYIPSNLFPVVANSPRIELSDPANLRLTNALTIEGWIYPRNTQTNFDVGVGTYYQQIFYRGDGRDCLDPYYLALYYNEPNKKYDVVFHVEDATGVYCGFDLYSTNMPVVPDQWQHVAAVFESNIPVPGAPVNTNGQPALTNQLSIYLDGKLIAAGYTPLAPFADLDPAFTPGAAIGNRSRYSRLSETFTDAEPFYGFIDDIAIYGRALTEPEIRGIYDMDVLGKSDSTAPATKRLSKVRVKVDNVQLDLANGENAEFTTRTVAFTANYAETTLELTGLLPGTIVDKITLTERPAELNYLPEESLKDLVGEDSYGVWKLEIWDTRTGGAASSELVQLIDWRLDFLLTPVSPPAVVELAHGITYTNVLLSGQVQQFVVPVPQWATNATNVLLSATNRFTGAQAEIGVLFDGTNQSPVNITNALFWPPVAFGTNVLSTNTASGQFIVPGQNYYLTVTNPNPQTVTFAIGVWFDILALTNCQPVEGIVGPAGIPTYFQFDVPAQDDTNQNPREVVFLLNGAQSNLTLVVSQTLPLPDLSQYDYISRMASTNDQLVMVLTNNTPYPLSQSRWYAGIINSRATNVPFTVQACYSASITNAPRLIPLTNNIPFVAPANTEFAAPPGPPKWLFYEFDLTNNVDAMLFELYGLTGDADMILQREVPSGMAPYFDGSFRTGRSPEGVVVRLNRDLGDLRGKWYVGVYNNELVDVGYTVRVTTPDGSGLLNTALPLLLNMTSAAGPHGITLQWNSIPGEVYIVEFSQTVFPPVWSTLPIAQPIVATTPVSAIELPVGSTGKGFYRIRHVPRASVLVPPMSIRIEPDGRIRISWPSTYTGLLVQATRNLAGGAWFNTNLPITTEGDESVVYDTIGLDSKFYKLIAL